MSVTVLVPPPLHDCVQGASKLQVSAASVRAALLELEQNYPPLYRSICDETGKVRPHVNLFVNKTHVRDQQGLDTVLAPGDALIILPAVSGG